MPVPISYVEMMFNSWEIVGQFMHLREAYQRLLDLIRSGQLDMKRSVRSFIHWLDFPRRMETAAKSGNFECVVIQHRE